MMWWSTILPMWTKLTITSVLYRCCNLSSQYKKNITTKNNDVNRLRQSLNLTTCNKHLLPRCYHIKQHTNSIYSNVWVIYNYMINTLILIRFLNFRSLYLEIYHNKLLLKQGESWCRLKIPETMDYVCSPL
jgi:hypothetical protein